MDNHTICIKNYTRRERLIKKEKFVPCVSKQLIGMAIPVDLLSTRLLGLHSERMTVGGIYLKNYKGLPESLWTQNCNGLMV